VTRRIYSLRLLETSHRDSVARAASVSMSWSSYVERLIIADLDPTRGHGIPQPQRGEDMP